MKSLSNGGDSGPSRHHMPPRKNFHWQYCIMTSWVTTNGYQNISPPDIIGYCQGHCLSPTTWWQDSIAEPNLTYVIEHKGIWVGAN